MSFLFNVFGDLRSTLVESQLHVIGNSAHWRYPNGIKSHSLDVVKPRNNDLPRSPTVLSLGVVDIWAAVAVTGYGEPVSKDLIDGALFPC